MKMSEDRYSITPEGEQVIKDVVQYFADGHTIEEIAGFYDMDVTAIRVLMAIDSLTASRHG